MEESKRSPAPAHSPDKDSFPSSRQGTPRPAVLPQTGCPSDENRQQRPVFITNEDIAELLPLIWVPPRNPQPGEVDPHELVEVPSKTHPHTADSVDEDDVHKAEVGLGDERGEDAQKMEAEKKEADGDGDGEKSDAKTKMGDNVGDQHLPKQETTPRENPAGKSGRTTTSGKTLDKQMLIDALEFYSRAVCGNEALVPIDRTMSIAKLMNARRSVLVQMPLAHVHAMAKKKLLLQYAQRLEKGLEVTDLAEELLRGAESRLSMAKEMQLILFLCTVKGGDSRPDMKYRDLEKKLLDVLDSCTKPLFISEDSMYRDALSSGRWGAVKRMHEQREELEPGDLDSVCLLAAMTQDWAVFLDCAARGASILGTPKTEEYLQKLQLEVAGGEWKDRYGIGPQAWKGSSPLHNALRSGHCPMKKLAALIGLDQELASAVDLSGDSLFHAAVQGMDAEAVQVLLRCEADVNIKDSQGRTPLQLVMTEATKLIAPQDVKPNPATPKANAASMEKQTGTESDGRPVTEKGQVPPQGRDRGSEDQPGEGRELSTAIDIMVSLVSLAGRSRQVIEWPAGDNGWTALHILCAAGGHQHLKNFIRHGADSHAKQNGNTLIDSVVRQKNLTVDQKMKTLRVLIMDLNLTDFQGEVASDLILQTQRQPPPCVADPSADPTSSGQTTPEPGSSHHQSEAEDSPVQTAGVKDLGDGRRTSDNPYNIQIFGEIDSDSEEDDGGSDSDSSAESDVNLYKHPTECVETILNMKSIPSLRQSGLLTSILHYTQVRDKAMVDTLVKAALARAERPEETAEELKEVFQVFNCKKTQRFLSRYMKYKALPTKTVEEAYNRGDFSTVMQLGRSGAAVLPRELTIVMVVAAQQYYDPKLFYDCFERGGLLHGIPYKDRKMDRKGAAEVQGDSLSSASPQHRSQRAGSEPGEVKVEQGKGEEAVPRPDSPGGDATHSKEEKASAPTSAEVTPSHHQQKKKKWKAVASPLQRALRNRFFSLSELVQRTGIAIPEHIRSAERRASSLLHFHVDKPITDSDMDNLVFLLSHGADINAAGDVHGHTLVQTLTELQQGQAMAKLVRLAVELGQSIDWTPHRNGWTALHVLAASGACEDILFCVQHGADPTVLRSRRHEREHACLSCRHHQHKIKRTGRPSTGREDNRPDTGREDSRPDTGREDSRPKAWWWVEAVKTGSYVVTDGLTLVDTVLLQPALSEDGKMSVLRVLLEDLQLGPLHARVVDKRPAGRYSEGARSPTLRYRYPLEAVLQPSLVTARTRHALLELVELMVRKGAVGEVERGAILSKMEEYRKFPFCQPALDFLAGGQVQTP